MKTDSNKFSPNLLSRRKVLQYVAASVLAGGTVFFSAASATASGQKQLIVYFSRTGNTRAVAEHLHKLSGANMVELQPVKPYPKEYRATTEQAKRELTAGYRPPLSTKIEDMENYGMVFVGSPNWWGTIAPPVMTFLTSYDFSGKTIAPFITHGGSALGRSMADIQRLCPGAKVVEGLAIPGSYAATSERKVAAWLESLGVSHSRL